MTDSQTQATAQILNAQLGGSRIQRFYKNFGELIQMTGIYQHSYSTLCYHDSSRMILNVLPGNLCDVDNIVKNLEILIHKNLEFDYSKIKTTYNGLINNLTTKFRYMGCQYELSFTGYKPTPESEV